MARDTRSTEQIKNALRAGATLARHIALDPMAHPVNKRLGEELHRKMNRDLDELERRRR